MQRAKGSAGGIRKAGAGGGGSGLAARARSLLNGRILPVRK